MASPTDITSTIGTWLAVFIALIALVSIIPIFLVYRKSRSDKALALALVHDPIGKNVQCRGWLSNF